MEMKYFFMVSEDHIVTTGVLLSQDKGTKNRLIPEFCFPLLPNYLFTEKSEIRKNQKRKKAGKPAFLLQISCRNNLELKNYLTSSKSTSVTS